MAEPISISASIVTLVQMSVAVVRYLGDVKYHPHYVSRLRIEIDSLQSVLLPALQHLEWSEDGNPAPGRLIKAQNGPLQELRVMLEDLEKRLEPTAGLRKVQKAVTWPFRKSEVSDIVDAIERQKSLFKLTLQLNNHELLQETRRLCYEAHDGITELAEKVAKGMRVYEAMEMPRGRESDEIWAPAVHNGNNYGACNAVYGGSQVFSGATVFFGT